MREKIIKVNDVTTLAQQLHEQNLSLVLAGGCFDILHSGHISFLKKSKALGEFLLILLESDARVKQLKGESRPVNRQAQRAQILAALSYVDAVITLPDVMTDELYDKLIFSIKPAIISTTIGDPYINHKKRQAEMVKGKVVAVLERIPKTSTSLYVHELEKNYGK